MKTVNKYGDYKKNRYVIEVSTKQVYVIVDRNHPQRTVFIRPIETAVALEQYRNGIIRAGNMNRHRSMGNWRTLKELRKHYALLDPKVMRVLYGTKA